MASAPMTPTMRPRVTAPKMKPSVSSTGESGGIRKSTWLPCTLEMVSDEDVFWKAFCNIDITTRPGARKLL